MWQYKDVNENVITWFSAEEYMMQADKLERIKQEMMLDCYGLCGTCLKCFECKNKKVLDIIGE